MKPLLALIVIYIGTFFVVIQGSSQNSVNAAPQASASAPGMASAQSNANIDPLKEADIRSLMELPGARDMVADGAKDRKSTRLNSSHLGISYAVFCLKKKNNNTSNT